MKEDAIQREFVSFIEIVYNQALISQAYRRALWGQTDGFTDDELADIRKVLDVLNKAYKESEDDGRANN